MWVSVLMFYTANLWAFEGVCGRSDRQSGKPYMANWQPITPLCLFVYPGRKFSHISTEKSPKLTGTNRFVTNNEKKGGFWLTTNKLVFWKIVLAHSHQTDTAIKHRGGSQSGGNVYVYLNVWRGEWWLSLHANRKMHDQSLSVCGGCHGSR